MTGGEVLKFIRKELDLKQKDLVEPGLKDISGVETGKIQMSTPLAIRLAARINNIIKERNLEGILDFEVTSKTFTVGIELDFEECYKQMRIDSSIEGFLELLKKNTGKYMYGHLERAIGILGLNYYDNLDKIQCLSLCIIEDTTNTDSLTFAYLQLTRVYYYQEQFEGIIALYQVIKDRVYICSSDKWKDGIYINTATAYYRCKEYDKALEIIKLIAIYDESMKDKVNTLLLNIYIEKNELEEALGIAYNILHHTSDINYKLVATVNICVIAALNSDKDLFYVNFNSIDDSRVHMDYVNAQSLTWLINCCNLLKLNNKEIFLKIFNLCSDIKFEYILEYKSYIEQNILNFSKALLQSRCKIDTELFVFLYKNKSISKIDKENLLKKV